MNSVDENLNNTNPERALPASSLAAIEHTIRTHSRISRQVLTPNGAIGINLVATFILLMGGITAAYMTWVLYRAKDGSIAKADLNFLPIAGLISFGCVAVGTRLLFRYPRWSLPFADFQSWRITCGPLPTLFYLVGAYQAYVCVRRIDLEDKRAARRLRRWVEDYLFCPLAVHFSAPAVPDAARASPGPARRQEINRYSPFLFAMAMSNDSNLLAHAWKSVYKVAERYRTDEALHETMCAMTSRWLRVVDSMHSYDTRREAACMATVRGDLTWIIDAAASKLAESPLPSPKKLQPIEQIIGICFVIILWTVLIALSLRFDGKTLATGIVSAVVATFAVPLALWGVRLNRVKQHAADNADSERSALSIHKLVESGEGQSESMPTYPTPPPQC